MNAVKIGIDLGGTKVLMIAGGLEERFNTGSDFTPSQLETILKAFIEKNHLNPNGIGIAIPGLLTADGGVVSCDVLPHFKGWNANKALSKFSPVVKAINDIRAALAQEFSDSEGNFTGGVIMVGTAVGAAFIVNGKPLVGDSGWAGEFGYFPLIINKEIKRIDEVCGGAFLAQQFNLTALEMYNLAKLEDEEVLCGIELAGYYLGVGIAGLVNLFNPKKISIGGGTASLPGYWKGIEKGARENTLPEFWKDDLLDKVKNGSKVAALGAVSIL
ncbi:ROK family protein [uncultured Cyclobacterium sp.]|uniref:ROK family protein n=1 Tax=uncultured Cyclobacterium sp. TaxID=453820 RepID=UPI0030ED467B|tara:strand:+ start:79950 stop:80765 length:816 start_codon:yes stop_codon:yes gene_type:complete